MREIDKADLILGDTLAEYLEIALILVSILPSDAVVKDCASVISGWKIPLDSDLLGTGDNGIICWAEGSTWRLN